MKRAILSCAVLVLLSHDLIGIGTPWRAPAAVLPARPPAARPAATYYYYYGEDGSPCPGGVCRPQARARAPFFRGGLR